MRLGKEVTAWDEELMRGPPAPRAREAGRSSKAFKPQETQIRTTREWLSHFLGKSQSRRCQVCLAIKSTGFGDIRCGFEPLV